MRNLTPDFWDCTIAIALGFIAGGVFVLFVLEAV